MCKRECDMIRSNQMKGEDRLCISLLHIMAWNMAP